MLKIKEYVKAESLEQAYELNQKRTNCILGGMLWLKMSNRRTVPEPCNDWWKYIRTLWIFGCTDGVSCNGQLRRTV